MVYFFTTTLSKPGVYAVKNVWVSFLLLHFAKKIALAARLYFQAHHFQFLHSSFHVFLSTVLDFSYYNYRFYSIFASSTFTAAIQGFQRSLLKNEAYSKTILTKLGCNRRLLFPSPLVLIWPSCKNVSRKSPSNTLYPVSYLTNIYICLWKSNFAAFFTIFVLLKVATHFFSRLTTCQGRQLFSRPLLHNVSKRILFQYF